MPFRSKAQRRKFAELLVKGKISPEPYEEWNKATGSKELPERVEPKPRRAPIAKRKSSPPKKRATASKPRAVSNSRRKTTSKSK